MLSHTTSGSDTAIQNRVTADGACAHALLVPPPPLLLLPRVSIVEDEGDEFPEAPAPLDADRVVTIFLFFSFSFFSSPFGLIIVSGFPYNL